MANTTPYIGSKISLISKAEIRYEGTLYKIDTDESTVTLSRVRSYGTEDRDAAKSVPPRDDVFEYIVFKGSDIKDLTVHPEEDSSTAQTSVPEEQQDPAILSSAPLAPMYPPHTGPGHTMYPPPSSGAMFHQPHFRPTPNYPVRMPYWSGPPPPGGPHHLSGPPPMGGPLPPGPPIAGMYPMPHPQLGPRYRDPMPPTGGGWQPRPHYMGSYSPTSQHVNPPLSEPQSSELPHEGNRTPERLSDLASRKLEGTEGRETGSGGNEVGVQEQEVAVETAPKESNISPSSKGHPVSAVVKTSSVQSSSVEHEIVQDSFPSQDTQQSSTSQHNRVEIVPGNSMESDRTTSQNRQGGEYRSHAPQSSREGKPPADVQHRSHQSYAHREQVSHNKARGGRSGGSVGDRDEQRTQHHGYRGQSNRGNRYHSRPGGRGGTGGYKKSLKFEGEFDFESANARFNKEGLEEEFKEKLKVDGKDVVTPEEEIEEIEEGELAAYVASPTYDKTSSFFDSISREVQSSDSRSYNRGEERSLNVETFGASDYKRGGSYRGRRGRGRGRGYYHRGYHGNRYHDEQRGGYHGNRHHDEHRGGYHGNRHQDEQRGGYQGNRHHDEQRGGYRGNRHHDEQRVSYRENRHQYEQRRGYYDNRYQDEQRGGRGRGREYHSSQRVRPNQSET